MVLFYGQVLTENNILGGARAGSVTKIDVSRFDDFSVGGYVVLKGMTREQYDANQGNYAAAKVQFNAFATYKSGQMSRVSMSDSWIGEYGITVTNRGRVGMELRKGGPEGEKVAFLPAMAANQPLYSNSTEMITLFPVFVVYNRSTQTVTTIKSTELSDMVTASPRPVSGVNIEGLPATHFPNDPTNTWEKILGTLKSPVAYVTVSSGVINQAIYFTNAGGTRYQSQNGYYGMNSGEQLTFEVEAGDWDEETQAGGANKMLIAMVYNGSVQVPIQFAADAGTNVAPLLKNGYEYMVSITGGGMDASGYTARITEIRKRDFSGDLENPM
jgi:hypothetical protein